jgi:hypothetical protein
MLNKVLLHYAHREPVRDDQVGRFWDESHVRTAIAETSH